MSLGKPRWFLPALRTIVSAAARRTLPHRRLFTAPARDAEVLGALPKRVTIYEVGARDGLQNEKKQISTDTKVELINRLADTGIKYIEAGSFVSPKWVAQMSDTAVIMQRINRYPGVSYPVLTPNVRGVKDAIAAGAREIGIFASASESFSKKNINRTISESLERYKDVAAVAKQNNIKMRGYVSCVLGCPYEGPIAPKAVAAVSKTLHDMGCYEISLGDTIGIGTPGSTLRMLNEVKTVVPLSNLAVHFHDTYGQALANILISLQSGISVVDSSVSGLGGCPYAQGATGNVATEDVVFMLHGCGVETGTDLDKLVSVGRFISDALGRQPGSKAALAMEAKAKSNSGAAKTTTTTTKSNNTASTQQNVATAEQSTTNPTGVAGEAYRRASTGTRRAPAPSPA